MAYLKHVQMRETIPLRCDDCGQGPASTIYVNGKPAQLCNLCYLKRRRKWEEEEKEGDFD